MADAEVSKTFVARRVSSSLTSGTIPRLIAGRSPKEEVVGLLLFWRVAMNAQAQHPCPKHAAKTRWKSPICPKATFDTTVNSTLP